MGSNIDNKNTATPRQRWALYLITKKDYRNVELTKEDAAKLISELGDPNYKKKEKKEKPATTTGEKEKLSPLGRKLEKYLVDHFEDIWKACGESLKIKAVVEEDKPNDPNRKRYAMIGFGCSVSSWKYRKNNKKAAEIAKAGNKLIYGKIEDMFVARFTAEEQDHYERIGCPLRAIFSQDENIQSQCHYLVTKFAKEQGIKMDYETRLD